MVSRDIGADLSDPLVGYAELEALIKRRVQVLLYCLGLLFQLLLTVVH